LAMIGNESIRELAVLAVRECISVNANSEIRSCVAARRGRHIKNGSSREDDDESNFAFTAAVARSGHTERLTASSVAVVVPFGHQMPLKEGQNLRVNAAVLGPDSMSP
jgi:hypothetical protein